MTNLLIKLFVKNSELINDAKVRGQYGTLSSVTGIVCNIILFSLKFIMGSLTNSIAIISDAFNNLSDSLSCVVSLFAYKLAAKPADKDHPFGHGRMEYLASLFIAVLIILVGFEFFTTSIEKIIEPTSIKFSFIALVSLLLSIGIKFWMFGFNMKLGNKINSATMKATAFDSISDVIVTSVTLISLFASLITDLPIDGIIGVIVSLFILISGAKIIKETVDTLLGQPAKPELVEDLLKIINSKEVCLGVHDLIIHNYGPGTVIASVHVEVSSKGDFLEAHDQIDLIEKEVAKELGVLLTIHMDPIETDNEQLKEMKKIVDDIVKEIDNLLSIHDFRMVKGDSHTNLIFDIDAPFDVKISNQDIMAQVKAKIEQNYANHYCVITVDRSH